MPGRPVRFQAAFCTEIGDRESNEDCAAVYAGGRVFLVADGMGGQRGGGVASRLAAQVVGEAVEAGLGAHAEGGAADPLRRLEELFAAANQRLVAEVRANPGLWGLGTTLTVGVVLGERLFFGHVGDSRLYRWRAGACQQLTEDHTRADELARQGVLTAAQARRSPQRNILTRHLGAPRAVAPQLGDCDLAPGDRLLLCSDGVHTGLEPELLPGLLAADLDPGEAAAGLVSAARSAPRPRDNLTALVVAVDA